MSPTLTGSLEIQRLKQDYMIEICNGIITQDRHGILCSCLYTPTHTASVPSLKSGKVKASSNSGEQDFSEQEQILFERRFEEGFDIKNDERYNTWLAQFHPGIGKLHVLDIVVGTYTCSCNLYDTFLIHCSQRKDFH